MKIDAFDFALPEGLIAQHPVFPRDSSKLLVVKDGVISNDISGNLADYVQTGDVIVFNDTKVIPARIIGKRGEAHIETTLFKRLDRGGNETWECLVKNAKRLRVGDVIELGSDFSANVLEKSDKVVLEFNKNASDFMISLHTYGIMPLPPYIRKGHAEAEDNESYQTIYAKHKGAIAAPTAGLHFTPQLLERLKNKGVQFAYVTLHVGGGTFLPVKVEDTDDHVMHAEFGIIPQETADTINAAKGQGKRIISIGTTSLRLIEAASSNEGIVSEFRDYTDIFITPGYKFKTVDMLMTNFHLPKSTLFMLVSAFAGLEEMKAGYNQAINNGYRFYSYGDSSLLFKKS